MRLVQFSVLRYRSIIETERLELRDHTVLVGPNNEGKSNLLQALVTAMRHLTRSSSIVPAVARFRKADRSRGDYIWERDFPQSLQTTQPDGRTIFNLDFELAPKEITRFERVVGSKLNGILPIGLSFGKDSNFAFSVRKQRHSKALSAKRRLIAQFVSESLLLQYIPASRTASSAVSVVSSMVEQELAELHDNEDYFDALETIEEIENERLRELEKVLCSNLQQLLPDVSDVSLEVEEDRLRRPPSVRVVVNDGSATDIAFKGDGVQSLAALALTRHHVAQKATAGELLLAVEEPEAHLHPKAIHDVASVLRETSKKQQVVVSTHSPLLVNRFDLASNIIVEKSRARRAESVSELREALGVRTSDNLSSADVVLVVEGPADEKAVKALLSDTSPRLRQALRDGTFAVQPLFGGAKLPYVLSQLKLSLCRVHTFLDHDKAGRDAATRAADEGLLEPADQTFATVTGAKDSELEDLYETSVYAAQTLREFNVDLKKAAVMKKTGQGKWTSRVKLAFAASGQTWGSKTEIVLKTTVADAVAKAPNGALTSQGKSVLRSLRTALETKLDESSA